MSILTVGTGQTYAHIADAVAASHDGDVIQVQAGTYVNDFVTTNTKITIEGVGGIAHLLATASPPNGKAYITENTDLTIDHLAFSGVQVGDNNGAGIRYQGGNLVVTNSDFYDNENGILGASPVAGTGTISISGSEFSHNGEGDGYSHNLYIGDIASLTIDNSYFHDAVVGHEIKTRAEQTTITNSRITDGPLGTSSYSIDAPNGGTVLIKNDVIEQGPGSQNPQIITFGEEGGVHANSSLTVSNDTILNDLNSGSVSAVWNATGAAATVSNNSFYGLQTYQYTRGPANITGTTVLGTEPTLDTTSPWASNATTVADTIVLHVSEDAYQGDAAFTVDVNGIPVGTTQSVTTSHASGLSQAFTISGQFAPGPLTVGVDYINQAGDAGGDRNLYVNSIDLNGTANASATAALFKNGTADFLITAAAAPPPPPPPPPSPTNDTLVVSLSEDAYTGDANFSLVVDGQVLTATQAVTASHAAGQTQAFTYHGNYGTGSHRVVVNFLNDAYGTSPGQDRNLYVDSVTLDGSPSNPLAAPLYSDGAASFNVAAPTTPTGPQNDTLVLSLSEDAYAGDAQFIVTVDGHTLAPAQSVAANHGSGHTQPFTFNGAWGAGAHTVGVSFINDAYGPGGDRNLYIDSITLNGNAASGSYAPLYSNGTENFSVSGNNQAPPITPDTLGLNLAEDAYAGDAQFIVTIDGRSLGPAQSVSALNSAGASQKFSFQGSFGAGSHDIGVSFINDAYGGYGQDRNLYVKSIDLDGTHYPAATANLYNNGTAHFSLTIPTH